VVVKVMRPEYAKTLGAGRFHREIMILTSLDHPNIVPLIASNEIGELPYYVIPYAPGGSLDRLLVERVYLPLEEVLAIARQVAAALDYAHARKVLHRDVKPGNILFDGDRALVCDFGIARAVELAGGLSLSSTGLIVGTPHYMSPEQALVDKKIDGRADIYALGCVVYEMLVGQPAFDGPTVRAIIAKQLGQRPPSIRVVRPEVPEQVEFAIIERALAKKRRHRPATAGEFIELLAS
jgi:serine/threonine protein kinase